jgi:hypothetical protein
MGVVAVSPGAQPGYSGSALYGRGAQASLIGGMEDAIPPIGRKIQDKQGGELGVGDSSPETPGLR